MMKMLPCCLLPEDVVLHNKIVTKSQTSPALRDSDGFDREKLKRSRLFFGTQCVEHRNTSGKMWKCCQCFHNILASEWKTIKIESFNLRAQTQISQTIATQLSFEDT